MSRKQREVVEYSQLKDMQRYLGEETYDDYKEGHISRRRMLKRLILICGGTAGAAALLAACGDTATSAATTTSATTTATNATTIATTNATTTTTVATSAVMTTPVATTTIAATTTSVTNAATTTAASGAAKSPLSVPADDPSLSTSDVTYQSDTTMYGYLARPKAAGNYPIVVVIHQNTGLNDHIKDVARRVAKAGYIAVAPDLASRAGGTAKLPADQVTGYFANAKTSDMVTDLNATVNFLQKQSGAQIDKVGVVGFCYGGGLTLSLAAANPKIIAAVSYYGPAPQPVSQMSNTQAVILGQYGALDQRVDSTIPPMAEVLKSSGKTFVQNVYPGANHAFNDDTRPSYVESAALPAWKATLDWFSKYL